MCSNDANAIDVRLFAVSTLLLAGRGSWIVHQAERRLVVPGVS
jgi:hypothetical protein